jgi:D-3-phosphoglycerate dehydrogenase
MLSLLRSTHVANAQLHRGEWVRLFGRRISEVTIGIIGVGRIGQRVLRHLSSFGTPRVLVNDLKPDDRLVPQTKLVWTDKEEIYKQADIISLHLPLTKHTKDMIRAEHIALMKPDAILINTARGGIINERDLANALKAGQLHGAAIDVFESEPYTGPLADIERCILTSHMGSMTIDCRSRMEIEATEDAVRFLKGLPLEREVPEEEYNVQRAGL